MATIPIVQYCGPRQGTFGGKLACAFLNTCTVHTKEWVSQHCISPGSTHGHCLLKVPNGPKVFTGLTY